MKEVAELMLILTSEVFGIDFHQAVVPLAYRLVKPMVYPFEQNEPSPLRLVLQSNNEINLQRVVALPRECALGTNRALRNHRSEN
jgi:hypothetical protein